MSLRSPRGASTRRRPAKRKQAKRQRLFDEQANLMPNFKDYEKAVEGKREIPVFVLTPA